MSSRSSSSSARLAKRQRTSNTSTSRRLPAFGAASEADLQSAQADAPSSSALSTRTVPPDHIATLTTLCARVFVANIRELAKDEDTWAVTRHWLKTVPDSLITRVFAMLRASSPTILSHGFILADFLRGPSITLTEELTGVKQFTIAGIAGAGTTLRELNLIGFPNFPDSLFATLLRKLPSLRVLNLRGCTKVGAMTAQAATKYCHLLTTVNLSYTTVTPASLASLVLSLPELEVLKLAGMSNWTDGTFMKFSAALRQHEDFQMTKLCTLKLRQTTLSDHSLDFMLSACPNLRRLDLSFTAVRHPVRLTSEVIPPLEKLSLTSTSVSNADLLTVLSNLPHLKTLACGALGGGQGSSAAIANSSAMTMTDDTLRALTDILEKCVDLEDVNLVGNTKLGLGGKRDRALAKFIARVGRKCKRLNLSNISSLRSDDLCGLLPSDMAGDVHSPLRTLTLNYTSVGDEAAQYISACPLLTTLELQGTKFTSTGLFPIIDACPKLEKLDLTSCRGVKVVDRRRFFEVWEKERENVEA